MKAIIGALLIAGAFIVLGLAALKIRPYTGARGLTERRYDLAAEAASLLVTGLIGFGFAFLGSFAANTGFGALGVLEIGTATAIIAGSIAVLVICTRRATSLERPTVPPVQADIIGMEPRPKRRSGGNLPRNPRRKAA